jgi:hypothetical protein
MRNRGTQLSAAAVLVAAAPVAAWGLMGQQNAAQLPPSQLDYAFRPWDLPNGLDTALGAVALLLAGVGAALLVRDTRRGSLDRRWWGVLAPLIVAGLLVGVGWRVLTAGVIGANIGAGLAIFFGGPVVAGLLLWALVRGVQLTVRPRDGDGRGGHWTGFAPRGV